jgi:hypothetical protein
MPENAALKRLRTLDAVAAEQGAVLAFRLCEASTDLEPVFVRISCANPGEENETALIAIDDQAGLSLGRYVINRDGLDAALERVEDVDADDAEPAAVPLDWRRE